MIIIKTWTTDTAALGVPRGSVYVRIPPCCSGGRSWEMIIPREPTPSRSGGPGTLCSLPGHILLMGSLCVCKVRGSFMSPCWTGWHYGCSQCHWRSDFFIELPQITSRVARAGLKTSGEMILCSQIMMLSEFEIIGIRHGLGRTNEARGKLQSLLVFF